MAQHFDVAVVGGRPAALITAALLAKRGQRVLWIDHNERQQPNIVGGWHLPCHSDLIYAMGDSPCVKKVHATLGLAPPMRNHASQTTLAGICGSHRVDLTGSKECILQELVSEFPRLKQAIGTFVARIERSNDTISAFLDGTKMVPPETFEQRLGIWWNQRPIARMLAPLDQVAEDILFGEIPRGHPLRRLFLGASSQLSSTWGAPSILAAVRCMSRFLAGAPAIAADSHQLDTILVQAARHAGVEMRRGARVQNLVVVHRKAVALQIDDERHTVGASYVVDASCGPLAASQAELGPRRMGARVTFNLVVERRVIPQPLARRSLLVSAQDSNKPSDEPMLLTRMPCDPRDGTDSDEVISLTLPCVDENLLAKGSSQNSFIEALLGRLETVIPFLRDGIRHVSFAEPRNNAAPLYAQDPRAALGIAGRSRRTRVKNLVYAGPEVVPGLGLEGDYLAATGAVALIQQLAGIKRPS